MIGLFPLKQSTASQEVLLGPFLDDTDGKTAETGLTIANTDIKVWVSGGTSEASKNSGGATHIASGRYYAVLDATDTATLGPLEINVHVAGALPVKLRCIVLTANAYDSLVAGSDRLQIDVAEYSSGLTPLQPTTAGRTLDVTATGAAGIDWGNVENPTTSNNLSGTNISATQGVALCDALGANALNAAALAPDAVTEIQSGLSTLDAAGVRTAVGLATNNLDTQLAAIDDLLDTEVAAIYSRIGAPAGASIAADIAGVKIDSAAILADTTELQTDWVNGGRLDLLVDAIKAKTDGLPADPADASDVASSFSTVNGKLDTIDDFLDTEVAAIKLKTDLIPASPAATGDIPSASAVATQVLAQSLAAESYAADGGTPTLSQVLWMILQGLLDYSISGTTLTVKKQDGTAAMTFTLDSASEPTSRTRAT